MRGTCTGISVSESPFGDAKFPHPVNPAAGQSSLWYILPSAEVLWTSIILLSILLSRYYLHRPPPTTTKVKSLPAGLCLRHPTMPPYSSAQKQQIMQFVNLTQSKDTAAAKFLKAARWNLEEAIDA
ncbi:hypothetical protein BO94DRAFT_65158 [Aspergillus sclerotioniger CBS 115572]|uniref:Uncharacterized protein n=1 Tax=Aspergillus sclerotioniger CBS 115572 TaxID=1450535 RepID=A0A317WKW1_9EURO|nr:hypothetical protein BO94DRAFT_65158 [Aspergillus sclerotioniger CBS 115572]PWY87023.1 hypothetical protein BO94DRAFT_65158 [Aspergillus sclerotioniger CBS 115572]